MDSRLLELVDEVFFEIPASFESWAELKARILGATHSDYRLDPPLYGRVKDAFMAHMGPAGAQFLNPTRVDLLQRGAG